MFVLSLLLLTLQGVSIGGHMVKSNVHNGLETAEQLIGKSPKVNAEESTLGTQAANQDFLRSIAFHPSSVEFGAWSIGTARSYLVTLINKNANKSVHLSSISGSTQEFYSSFFEDKVVPPQSNTTFNVVFLPRSYGPVETNLFIHTSFGQARLPVRGEGKECPYRIKSLIGIKAPFNATITPEIHMYNPHPRPIQILEIYSSGGQFQLELPSGGQEGPQALWEIPAHTAKPIIRIRFHAHQPGNHTAFIRIKISEVPEQDEQKEENILVIPVEIEISEETGLYSSNPILDFGTLTTSDSQRILTLNLTNSGQHAYHGLEYHVQNVDGGLVKLNRSDLTLRLHPELAEHDVGLNGVLLVRMWRYTQSNGENKSQQKFVELSIGIRAEIYKGALEFQRNQTVFITGSQNYTRGTGERELYVENKFQVPVAVQNISVDNNDTNVFRLSDFAPTIISPGTVSTIFKIAVVNESANFRTLLHIVTNLSTYDLDVIVCSGLLTRYTSLDQKDFIPSPDPSVLNFGAVQYGDMSPFGFILLKNLNPVGISVVKWNVTNPRGVYFNAMFCGCSPLANISFYNAYCPSIGPQEVAGFQIAVQSRLVKSLTVSLYVRTQHEEIATAIEFFVVMGRLEVDQSRLHFTDCFPGKRCSADISIHSTFVKNMQVNSITVSVPGLIFEYHTQDGLPEIFANKVTDIGRIHFDPKSVCGKRCYIAQDNASNGDVELDATLGLDEVEIRRRTELFRRFKMSLQAITFTLNTSEVRLYEFSSNVDIVWPKLVKGHQIFPAIDIEQNYNGEIVIMNPSSRNVKVELELADPRKAKTTRLSLPLEVIDNCFYCYLTDEDLFRLGDGTEQKIMLTIQANSAASVPVKFSGRKAGEFSTLLHIYNNLTMYEAVWITGKAVQPQFRFGNRKPGSPTPLLFEVSERHLVDCERSATQQVQPLFVKTKRTFTARNTGEVPIMVEKFVINDSECEGHGFRIIDCSGFELMANSSRKVDIVFTPDFTMSRISHTLLIKTNLSSEVNYTLLATVPASSLEICSKALPRPFWEADMKKMSVGVLVVAFVFVLIAACIDSDKVLKDHVHNISKDKGPMQPPLDLRNIGMKHSQVDEPTTQADSVVAVVDKNSIRFGTAANIKKRNIKRSGFIAPSPLPNCGKDKSWAEELAKKITSGSPSRSATAASPKPTILSKAIQTVSASVATALTTKPSKEEKTSATRKTSSKDNGEANKPLVIQDKHSSPEVEKKSSLRPEKNIESKKQKFPVKKSKSVPLETGWKENGEQSTVSFATKTSEKTSFRNTKVSIKDCADSHHQSTGENKRSVELPPEVVNISKRDSPPTNAGRLSPRNNIQQKKFGKTPGRERKKELPFSHQQSSSKRKAPKFKGTAFQFTAPLGEGCSSTNSSPTSPSNSSAGPTSSAWDTSITESFSNIVAQKPTTSSPSDEPVQLYPDGVIKPAFEEIAQDTNNNSNHDWNEADLKNHETFGSDSEEKQNSTDLGPIGTKKSPSSTPVWEPFVGVTNNIHRPIASISAQPPSNTSFFSSHFPIGNSFDYSNQYMGGASGLLDQVFAGSQHFDHISPNDLLLTWLQQERLRQEVAGWTSTTNRTWTPMGYQDEPPLPTTPASDNFNSVWQPAMSSGVVRPPPGIPLRSNRGSPIHQPSQQPQMPQSQLSQNQQSQTQSDVNNLPNSSIDPYQPYGSFNSIWSSDAWNKSDKE